jgi:hypothetical protein
MGTRGSGEAVRLSIFLASEASSSLGFSSTGGGRSVVEWVPVVQGGMVMNSSKVRTRGLQHFQPATLLARP